VTATDVADVADLRADAREVLRSMPAADDGQRALRDRFVADYEEEFGTGTAWTEADILLVNTRVRAIGRSDVQAVKQVVGDDEERHELTRRAVLEPLTGEHAEIDVHRGFGALGRADGPCLLEEPDTTVYVPSGATVELTEGGDFLLSLADR